jgi:hypothetical protein
VGVISVTGGNSHAAAKLEKPKRWVMIGDGRRASRLWVPVRDLHVRSCAGACACHGARAGEDRSSGDARRSEVAYSVGIKRADMRRLLAEVVDRRDALLKEWERIHGQHD